jgi:hypothetical protein
MKTKDGLMERDECRSMCVVQRLHGSMVLPTRIIEINNLEPKNHGKTWKIFSRLMIANNQERADENRAIEGGVKSIIVLLRQDVPTSQKNLAALCNAEDSSGLRRLHDRARQSKVSMRKREKRI